MQNEKIAKDLEEMTKLKNAQSEKVQKAVKKGKSIQADLVETKKRRREGARVERFTTTNRHVGEATTKCRTNTGTTRYE